MASGLPVISTQLTGIPELADNGRTDIPVPPGDAEALFVALQKLYENPGLRRPGKNFARVQFET